MTIETRPDFCLMPHLSQMLSYGCTRLEIGLQSTYEDVARDTNRGHTVAAVGECFQLAKDAGFKVRALGRTGEGGGGGVTPSAGTHAVLPAQVIAHMMPDLPNVGWERDIESIREFFENPAFRTDGLKLYPTLVIRGTGLYELWKRGLYRNYAPDKVRCHDGRALGCCITGGGRSAVHAARAPQPERAPLRAAAGGPGGAHPRLRAPMGAHLPHPA